MLDREDLEAIRDVLGLLRSAVQTGKQVERAKHLVEAYEISYEGRLLHKVIAAIEEQQ